MAARLLRTLALATLGAVLVVLTFAGAGSAEAAIPDRSFQVMGCNIGDYQCYYARLGGGGSTYTYYCQNGYYTCTNGVPDGPALGTTNGSPYCADGGGTGCIDGSPLFVNIGNVVNGSGLASGATGGNIIVTSGFANAGTSLTHRENP